MDRESVCYYVGRKNPTYGQAITAGFNARVVPAERGHLERGNVLHLISGLQHGSLELMQQAIAEAVPFVFFDRAYFGGGPGSGRLRATHGAYQQNWVRSDAPRVAAAQLAPWQRNGNFVMLVPPGEAVRRLFGLGDWEAHTLARLRRCTSRLVIVSHKGADPRPIAHRLRGCWCVVTWSSNVAVDAIMAGVPAVVAPCSAAAPVAGRLDDLEQFVERPVYPAREQWYASLLQGQFTLEGIRSGLARSAVLGGE